MRFAVLGAGTVGDAAAWHLSELGHEVEVFDRDRAAAERVASEHQVSAAVLDVGDASRLRHALEPHDALISAVPYYLGLQVTEAAIAASTHYFDFGGNPDVVRRQLDLDRAARDADIVAVPDCGLAPGLANVLALGLVRQFDDEDLDEVRIRAGALPQQPVGPLGYQLAFSPDGLINEYSEPCEVLSDGRLSTVDPLTGVEEVDWPRWGPLEAFHTAGGSSTLPALLAGRVRALDYKTLRYPGHAAIFRTMLELGLFDERERDVAGTMVPPRRLLLQALAERLPRGAPDVVLIRAWVRRRRDDPTSSAGLQIEDLHDGRFSALARMTAFPATTLAHLIVNGEVATRGVVAMAEAVPAEALIPGLERLGIRSESWQPPGG